MSDASVIAALQARLAHLTATQHQQPLHPTLSATSSPIPFDGTRDPPMSSQSMPAPSPHMMHASASSRYPPPSASRPHPSPAPSPMSHVLSQSANTPHASSLVAITNATIAGPSQNNASAKKKRLIEYSGTPMQRLMAFQSAAREDSLQQARLASLPVQMTPLTEQSSILQTLTHDLAAQATIQASPRGIEPPTAPTVSNAREFLSASTLSKLQQILSTAWLSDEQYLAKTEELLLHSRYYSSWKDAKTIASHPDFSRLHSSVESEARESIGEWIKFLNEGLFLQFTPATVAPPSANEGIFSDKYITQPSYSSFHFGSKLVLAFLVDRKLFVRVGGGFVDVIEYIRNYSAIEGRKVLAQFNRNELICLNLIMQERLFASVVKRIAMQNDMNTRLIKMENDLGYVTALKQHVAEFISKFQLDILNAKIKLSKQNLHWTWVKEERMRHFADANSARLALEKEEAAEELTVRNVETLLLQQFQQQQAQSKLFASQREEKESSDSNSNFNPNSAKGVVESMLESIQTTPLPSMLTSFMDDLSHVLTSLNDSYMSLHDRVQTSENQVKESREREMIQMQQVDGMHSQLKQQLDTLRTERESSSELQRLLAEKDAALQEAQKITREQSENWSKKLSVILEQVKRKESNQANERLNERDALTAEISSLNSAHHTELSNQREQFALELAQVREQLMQERIAEREAIQQERMVERETYTTNLKQLQDSLFQSKQNMNNATLESTDIIHTLKGQVATLQDELQRSQRDTNVLTSNMSAARQGLSDATQALEDLHRERRIVEDVEREVENWREQYLNTQTELQKEKEERRVEREQFKKDILQALQQQAVASSSKQLNSPLKGTLDQVELSVEDIVFDLPRESGGSIRSPQHHHPSAPLSPNSSSSNLFPALPSTVSPFIPLPLFTRVYNKYKRVGEQFLHLSNEHQQQLERMTSQSERVASLETSLLDSQQQLSLKEREQSQLQEELSRISAEHHQVGLNHQKQLKHLKESSEAKTTEISAIYTQMLNLKEVALLEVDSARKRLEVELDEARSSVDSVKLDMSKALAMQAQEYGNYQVERKKLIQERENYRRSMIRFPGLLQNTYADLKEVKHAYALLKEDFVRMTQSSLNIDVVRDTLQSQFDKHVALLNEYVRKYKYELSLRRKYFDQLQQLKGNIRVFVRIRPTIPSIATIGAEEQQVLRSQGIDPLAQAVFSNPHEDPCLLQLQYMPASKVPTLLNFEYDRVFNPSDSQDSVFKHVEGLVTSFMDGFNVAVMAYGQTGSGKTFTLLGPEHDPGVTFRVLQELFHIKRERSHGFSYKVSVSMLEIYNETIRDLLAPQPHSSLPAHMQAARLEHKIQDINGQITLSPPVTELPCHDEQAILNAIALGQRYRATSSTDSNSVSSRSHSVVQLKIVAKDLHSEKSFNSLMSLVDLAGSERLKKSNSTGERRTEAAYINKSLSALGNVLQSLQLGDAHVPFRACKLTHLLKSCLGGPSKALMIVTVTPDARDANETFCSLQFGSRARKVELVAAVASSNGLSGGNLSSPPPKKLPRSGPHLSRSASSPPAIVNFPDGYEDLDAEVAAQAAVSSSLRPTLTRTGSSSNLTAASNNLASPSSLAQKLKSTQATAQELQVKLNDALAREEALLNTISNKAHATQRSPVHENAKKFSFDLPSASSSSSSATVTAADIVLSPSRRSQTSESTTNTPRVSSSASSSSAAGVLMTTHVPQSPARSQQSKDRPSLSRSQSLASPSPPTHSASDIAHLTAMIASLEMKLHHKNRVEEELKAERQRAAERETAWAEKQARWKEQEERRKTVDALAAKNLQRRLTSSGSKDSESEIDRAHFEPKIDVHHPDSVTITRLTGDIHQLQHQLRMQNKQQAFLAKFLADNGLPSIEQLWRDRNFPKPHSHSVQHVSAPLSSSNSRSHSRSHSPSTQMMSSASSAVTSPAPSASSSSSSSFARTMPSSKELSQAIQEAASSSSSGAKKESSRSRSEERDAATSEKTKKEREVPSLSMSSVDALNESSTSVSSSASSTPRTGYVPHKSAPVFKNMIEPLPSKPKHPPVPKLSGTFSATSLDEQRLETEKAQAAAAKSPAPKPPVPRLGSGVSKIPRASPSGGKGATIPVQSEPIVIARRKSAPVEQVEEPTPPAAAAAVEVPATASSAAAAAVATPISPTQVLISKGLELSAKILSEQATTEAAATTVTTPVKSTSSLSSLFGGINFGQIAAEASAAVYSASPSAAPFLPTAASSGVNVKASPPPPSATTNPAAITVSSPSSASSSSKKTILSPTPVSPSGLTSPSNPKFVGEANVAAALAELKQTATAGGADLGPDHLILLSLAAPPSELANLNGVCVTDRKVIVFAKGRDALSPKWNAMFLTSDMAYFIVLLLRTPLGDDEGTMVSRFVVFDWMGDEVDANIAAAFQEFSPVLHSFLSKHISVSLYSSASHPIQVSRESIEDDLRPRGSSGKNREKGKRRSSSTDSEGSFVDLNAQLAAETAAAASSSSTGNDMSVLNDSDIVTAEQVEDELRKSRSVTLTGSSTTAAAAAVPPHTTPRKSSTSSSGAPTASPAKGHGFGSSASRSVGSMFNRPETATAYSAAPQQTLSARKPPVPTASGTPRRGSASDNKDKSTAAGSSTQPTASPIRSVLKHSPMSTPSASSSDAASSETTKKNVSFDF